MPTRANADFAGNFPGNGATTGPIATNCTSAAQRIARFWCAGAAAAPIRAANIACPDCGRLPLPRGRGVT